MNGVKSRIRRLIRDRSGVSEVIGALILISIIATAGFAVVTLGLTSINQNITIFTTQIFASQEMLRERIVIDDVWFNDSSLIHISVYNYGKKEVTIVEVSINYTDIKIDPEIIVHMGGREWITVTYSWSGGAFYVIEVYTSSGYRYVSYWKA